MAAESIINLKRPEYPKKEYTETGIVTRIEYIGDTATLEAAIPNIGATWGDYVGQVQSATIEPTENVNFSVLMITVDKATDNADIEPGELVAVSYEIRWVTVDRSMFEHPQFAINEGGLNALTKADIIDITAWRDQDPERFADLKEDYKYLRMGFEKTLSANAKLFARGIELGQETYEDKAPIAIKISEYVNGPPPETTAGLKEEPDGVPNIPSGFEWRKETADSTRAGGALKWNLTEEWVGAKKILTDREEIYWDAP